MIKKKQKKWTISLQSLLCLVFLSFSIVATFVASYFKFRPLNYSFFIEFDNLHGISRGTPIRMRGIDIGSIQSTKLKLDCVLALAKINSSKIFIPRDSIIETNQTGLLNEPVIDIIPFGIPSISSHINHNPLSNSCDSSSIICDQMYITGDRGLNYDDLVRSTTRISQRFDDPRFFNLFYVFLQNGIEVTDTFLELIASLLDVTSISYIYLQKFLSNNL
jgi:phospholipid/cholesterol/gamma-HCH transport system substrate-binding protein